MEEPLKILLLEDSPTDAELIQRLLKKEYRECIFKTVMTEDEFLQTLDKFNPNVILADNSLPQFNAPKALKIIRDRKLPIPFIMVTGSMREEFAINIIKGGADDYILKDRLTRLPAAIEAAIRHRQSEQEKDKVLQQLVESEEKYRSLIERVSDGFIALDTSWKFIYANNVAEEILGKPQGSLIGKNIWDEFPEAINKSFYNAYHDAMKFQRHVHLEEYSTTIDRWVEVDIYPSLTGISAYFKDITEQRKAEEEARKSEEKYRVFIQRITDGFIAIDKNWCYTYMNKQAGELTHRDPGEMIGRNVWKEFPDVVGSPTFKAFHKAMDEQQYVCNIDYYAPLDLWQENHIYPSPDGLSVFIRNITEKKKLEIELHEQQRQEQLKLTAIALEAQEKERNMLGQELHDNVNQLMVGGTLFLSMVKCETEKNQKLVNSCMENILAAVEETRNISHLLVAPDLETKSLAQQISLLSESMLKTTGLDVHVGTNDLKEDLLSDELKLTIYRIAQEQCTNIVKYAKAHLVNILLETTGGFFKMIIADDGIGMETDKKSAGIGLSNIKGRVSVFSGSARVTTAPYKGFELMVTIPLIQK
jgi:PAS domain S-box-containing protein